MCANNGSTLCKIEPKLVRFGSSADAQILASNYVRPFRWSSSDKIAEVRSLNFGYLETCTLKFIATQPKISKDNHMARPYRFRRRVLTGPTTSIHPHSHTPTFATVLYTEAISTTLPSLHIRYHQIRLAGRQ